MARKLQTIYGYLEGYTEEEIDSVIAELTIEDKILLKDKYGIDLHNPVKSDSLTASRNKLFYSYLGPKIKDLLDKKRGENTTMEVKVEDNNSELENKLFDLINDNKTNKEICEILNIDKDQLHELFLNLKNKGRTISRKYYSDGSILYVPTYNCYDMESFNIFDSTMPIITDTNEINIKMLAISDLHFGNELERIDLINKAFNYCAKNGINIILCAGDLIDGTFSQNNQTIPEVDEQLEYFAKNYPYDKNILTFAIGGDHDISAFKHKANNMVEFMNNYRHDVVMLGYKYGTINIKNDQILLYHSDQENGFSKVSTAPLILQGHYHNYQIYDKNNQLYVGVPSLSNIMQRVPTALELDISFHKGFMGYTFIRQLYFGNEDVVLSDIQFNLLSNRKFSFDGTTKYVESYKDEEVEFEKQLKPLLEKFGNKL